MECYYHKGEQLHNFCLSHQCTLPLCSKCISIHLAQTHIPHRLAPLTEILEHTLTSLSSLEAVLNREINSLREQYSPEAIMKQYSIVLKKHREEAVSTLNQKFSLLEKEMLLSITAKYNQYISVHLPATIGHLERISNLHRAAKDDSQKLKAAINFYSNDEPLNMDHFLSSLSIAKDSLKASLPRLAPGQGGVATVINPVEPQYSNNLTTFRDAGAPHQQRSLGNPITAMTGADRISILEARLASLRAQE